MIDTENLQKCLCPTTMFSLYKQNNGHILQINGQREEWKDECFIQINTVALDISLPFRMSYVSDRADCDEE